VFLRDLLGRGDVGLRFLGSVRDGRARVAVACCWACGLREWGREGERWRFNGVSLQRCPLGCLVITPKVWS
jgi:hypothetical protein